MSNDSPIPILVTGGAGYVGSHACKALAARGYAPIVYDNLGLGHEAAVRWGPLEVGDIADRDRLDSVIARYRPAAVMHFAAFSSVGESVANPGKYYRNNVAGTLSLLEAMRDHDIKSLVFSSTAAIYGTPDLVPIPEDARKAPINPYGQSKLIAEAMIADFAAAHAMSTAVLRYFNAAGADRDAEIGECHHPETHLIPLALQAITGAASPLTVFGDDYSTRDGTCIRDYIHVSDLADAHVLALDQILAARASITLNLGIGHGFSVSEVIAAIERVTGRSVPYAIGPRRDGDPPMLVASVDKAIDLLKWKPGYTELDSIVRTAWAWNQHGHKKSCPHQLTDGFVPA